ncbi:MFS transporter [Shimia sp. R10_1]|uniref:MFS transporter n=1 Tax=Shimia sp. R10_1 TaxID=2821095 RepID=UPI001ADA3044|nr:MFS transporter [Shimia sp. R10_1]MBO9472372.1 MFS transporter [Shimia sp. R10_1]
MAISESAVQHNVTLDDVVITVVMARVTDFFGFFVYAIASALVFPTVFFPHLDPLSGTLWSFGLFSLAFIARPIASMLARSIQYKIGRPGKITLALMILGSSTVAIGLLPGYQTWGIAAPVMLGVLRFVQGLGLGGAWDGITLQLKSAAPEGREGRYSMVAQLGGPIGFCVAAALFYVLTGFLTEEEFLTYGWRFAFFAVMAVNVVSLFARLRLLTTNFGSDDARLLQSAPLPQLIKTEWRTILLSALLPLSSYALFHMVTVFPLSYALLFSGRDITEILLLQLLGGTLAIGSVMVSGALADMLSRRIVLFISSLLTLVLCLSIATLETMPAIYILLGFVVLGLSYGQSSSIVPNRFKVEHQYSGSAMSTNLSWLLGAAFAPLTGLFLASTFGLWAAALYLLSGVVVTLIALYLLQDGDRKRAQAQ